MTKSGNGPLRTTVSIDESIYSVEERRSASSLSREIHATLDNRMADSLADMALDKLSRRIGIPPSHLGDFLKFLFEDPELRDKYIASVAAKRIIGDPLKD